MAIVDFFNPYNMRHIEAYRTLKKTGAWPKGFIPGKVKNSKLHCLSWGIRLRLKMSNAWVEQVLAGNVIGMPPIEHTERKH